MVLTPKISNKKLGIIVCADDFGTSFEVNDAIIELLRQKRISAVNCLVTGRAWDEEADLLKDFKDIVDIGLHLSYRDIPFNKILISAYLRRLGRKTIFKEFQSQLSCFFEKLGRLPDFIDGHNHIHQLPVFRLALMDLINTMGAEKIYIRNSAISLRDIFARKISILKNILIAIPGSSLKKYLSKRRIHTNDDLLGIYDFNTDKEAGKIVEAFLKTAKRPNSILMVHPGYGNKRCNYKNNCFDSKRKQEMEYLESEQYKNLLEHLGFYLTRFNLCTEKPLSS